MFTISQRPSGLYMKQAADISVFMRHLFLQTMLYPLHALPAFNKAGSEPAETKAKPSLKLSIMDDMQSIESQDIALKTTPALVSELVHLEENASDPLAYELSEIQEDNQHLTSSKIIGALHEIMNQYQDQIENDPLVCSDVETLMQCIIISKSAAARKCENILNHLIAEVKQGVKDDTRAADESPAYVTEDSVAHKHVQNLIDLKQSLADFRDTYLMAPIKK